MRWWRAYLGLTLLLFAASSLEGRQLAGNRTRKNAGLKRTFKAEGGAAVYLKQLEKDEPQKLSKIRRQSRVEKLAVPALAQMLDRDADLGIDLDNDVLIFECEGLVVNDPWNTPLEPQDFEPDPLASQAFQLSSRPSATRKIYLDFTGATILNTMWNNNRAAIIQPPYDKDNNPLSFSAAELNDIVAIWRAVSEDYAIFDVDVTTIRPADFYGNMWVSIGGNADWYGSTPGGVASVGTFGNTYFQPAFVFPKNLGPNYAKYVWEAASHEIGHTLGLFHDGVVDGATYYTGQGDWAPIMGTAYYKTLSTFDKGEYTNANQQQDDIATISSFLPLLAPTAGNSPATSAPLAVIVSGTTATGTASGVVVQQDAANYFSFQAGSAGWAKFQVNVMLPWSTNWARSDLDVQLVVFDTSNNIVNSINPTGVITNNGLGIAPSSGAVYLPSPGTYYIAVYGAGSGDAKSTGYSSYGSRGRFKITATYPADLNPPPVQTPSPSPDPPTPPPPVDPVVVEPPSPEPPNPSPSPTPEPPLNPPPSSLPAVMVSNIRISKSCSNLRCICTARVFVVEAESGVRIQSGVVVNGVWTATPAPGWNPNPYPVAGTVSRSGFVDLKALRQNPSGSCTFSLTDVKAAGYTWRVSSATSGTLDLSSRTRSRNFRAAGAP